MSRGSKDYDKVTHGASKKGTKEKQKAVWNMIGAKKKLHEMVEALINSDSKTAAAALHDYLQVKTRAILGEEDGEMEHEDGEGEDMVADRSEEDGEGEHDHEDGEECTECGAHPCECDDEGGEDEHEDSEHGEEEGGDDEGSEEEGGGMFGEGRLSEANLTKAKKGHFDGNAAPHLDRKVKGNLNYDKTSGSGTKKQNLTKSTGMKKNSEGAKGLESRVKGKLSFDKSSGTKKQNLTKATQIKKLSNGAKGLEVGKVKGNVKFSSSKPRTNNV